MNRKLTLPLLLTLIAFVICTSSFAINYTNTGGNSPNYSLGNGDTLFAVSGNYTGSITGFSFGAVIVVDGAANFTPSSFPNNAAGTMNVYGTVTLTGTPNIRTNTGFTLNNYGIFAINATGDIRMNGNNQTWTNNLGAVLNFNGLVIMNGNTGDINNVLNNYGTVNASSNFQMNSGSLLNNYKNMTVSGNFTVNGGVYNNEGKFETMGLLRLNNGASIIHNYCRMMSSGGIENSSGNLYNHNYLWARNDLGLGYILNSGSGNIYNVPVFQSVYSIPVIHGKDLTVSGGSITGSGVLYFYGTTSNTGGITGVAGVTTDTLKMYDITRGSTATFYEGAIGGTVHPNAIYNAWGVPDSTRVYLVGCSVEIIMEVPLAVNWNYFYVKLVGDVPVLTWSAEYDPGTVFEIQRSYDGVNFGNINLVASEVGQSEYSYSDKLVNTQSQVAYYRIKAIELSGESKYSITRNVKFSNKTGNSLQIVPNPFINNFFFNYKAAEKENITIRLFDVTGRQRLTKTVAVNTGSNIINISEAARLAKGIYVIQLTNGHNTISSGKIMKQ